MIMEWNIHKIGQYLSSLQSSLLRFAERVVGSQFQRALDEVDYLDLHSHAKAHNWNDIGCINVLWRTLDRDGLSVFSAAFGYGILLVCLWRLGIGGTVLWWLSFVLHGKFQSVLVGEERLSPRPLQCGGAPGLESSASLTSTLPSLGKVIHQYGVWFHQCAANHLLHTASNILKSMLAYFKRKLFCHTLG